MAGDQFLGEPDREERIVLHVDMDCFYASCDGIRDSVTAPQSRDYSRSTPVLSTRIDSCYVRSCLTVAPSLPLLVS